MGSQRQENESSSEREDVMPLQEWIALRDEFLKTIVYSELTANGLPEEQAMEVAHKAFSHGQEIISNSLNPQTSDALNHTLIPVPRVQKSEGPDSKEFD